VTVIVRWIPLVPAAYGTRVARTAGTTMLVPGGDGSQGPTAAVVGELQPLLLHAELFGQTLEQVGGPSVGGVAWRAIGWRSVGAIVAAGRCPERPARGPW
jgi:hypothetical protein